MSEVTKAALDKAIAEILETQRKRARDILTANKPLVTTLRDLLVEKKVLDAAALATLLPSIAQRPRRFGALIHGHHDLAAAQEIDPVSKKKNVWVKLEDELRRVADGARGAAQTPRRAAHRRRQGEAEELGTLVIEREGQGAVTKEKPNETPAQREGVTNKG